MAFSQGPGVTSSNKLATARNNFLMKTQKKSSNPPIVFSTGQMSSPGQSQYIGPMQSVPSSTMKIAPSSFTGYSSSNPIPGFDASSYTGSGSTGSGGGDKLKTYTAPADSTPDQLSFLRQQEMDAIGGEYDSELKRLRRMEDAVSSTGNAAIKQAQTYYPQFQKIIGDQQTSTETQLTGMENARKMESERAMGQAKQLLNDLNRRQMAQMSATGNYGTSAPEAFADQFGNKAYAAQSQIQQSRDNSLNELAQKHVEAKQYFDQKLFEGKQKYDALVTGLRSQLDAQLAQIASAKGAAASAKRAGVVQAWNNYVNNKFSLDQELRNYHMQLAQHQADMSLLTEQSGKQFDGYSAPGIDSSGNQQLQAGITLGQLQNNINSGGLTLNAPVYMQKKIKDPNDESSFLTGVGLNQ